MTSNSFLNNDYAITDCTGCTSRFNFSQIPPLDKPINQGILSAQFFNQQLANNEQQITFPNNTMNQTVSMAHDYRANQATPTLNVPLMSINPNQATHFGQNPLWFNQVNQGTQIQQEHLMNDGSNQTTPMLTIPPTLNNHINRATPILQNHMMYHHSNQPAQFAQQHLMNNLANPSSPMFHMPMMNNGANQGMTLAQEHLFNDRSSQTTPLLNVPLMGIDGNQATPFFQNHQMNNPPEQTPTFVQNPLWFNHLNHKTSTLQEHLLNDRSNQTTPMLHMPMMNNGTNQAMALAQEHLINDRSSQTTPMLNVPLMNIGANQATPFFQNHQINNPPDQTTTTFVQNPLWFNQVNQGTQIQQEHLMNDGSNQAAHMLNNPINHGPPVLQKPMMHHHSSQQAQLAQEHLMNDRSNQTTPMLNVPLMNIGANQTSSISHNHLLNNHFNQTNQMFQGHPINNPSNTTTPFLNAPLNNDSSNQINQQTVQDQYINSVSSQLAHQNPLWFGPANPTTNMPPDQQQTNTDSQDNQFEHKIATIEANDLSANESFVNSEYPESNLEKTIVESLNPIDVNETQEITANDFQGIWLNKQENLNWKGPIPLDQYKINNDPTPEVIKKKPTDKIKYKQEINVKYLVPPEPQKPGDIIIKQLPDKQITPAPPLVIRQPGKRSPTPPPLIIREAPPKPPSPISSKVINVSGKTIPPPARKVVIEKLPDIPAKPQSVLIERWLPYEPQKRKIVFQKSTEPAEVFPNPKNVIIKWDKPDVEITQEYKSLGVHDADPKEYYTKYGPELKTEKELPEIAKKVKAPEGYKFASERSSESLSELEYDIESLKLNDSRPTAPCYYSEYINEPNNSSKPTASNSNDSYSQLINDLFSSIESKKSGYVRVKDTEKVLYGLNENFEKKFSQKDFRKYLNDLDSNKDGLLDFKEFTKAFFWIYY